jgi:hypothetical protein
MTVAKEVSNAMSDLGPGPINNGGSLPSRNHMGDIVMSGKLNVYLGAMIIRRRMVGGKDKLPRWSKSYFQKMFFFRLKGKDKGTSWEV